MSVVHVNPIGRPRVDKADTEEGTSSTASTQPVPTGIPLVTPDETGAKGFMDGSGRFLVGPYAGDTMLDWALQYAEHGYYAFQLRDGSKGFFGNCRRCDSKGDYYESDRHRDGRENCTLHPAGYARCHGLYAATTNPDVIRRWWSDNPHANIGINCGRSGIALVDTDVTDGKTGEANLAAIAASFEPLPDGPRARTATHGGHRLFDIPREMDLRSSTGSDKQMTGLADAVDIKANGGLMVAAPSVIRDKKTGLVKGQYVWENDPWQQRHDLPLWIPEEVERRRASKRSAAVPLARVGDGWINSQTGRTAGELAGYEETRARVEELADEIRYASGPNLGTHGLLLAQPLKAYQYAMHGQISEEEVTNIMRDAGLAAGRDPGEVERAVLGGLDYARRMPDPRPWFARYSSSRTDSDVPGDSAVDGGAHIPTPRDPEGIGSAYNQQEGDQESLDADALRRERARRRAHRIVDSEELQRTAEDPEYEATQYQAEYVREKARLEAKKRIAAELRVEEPVTDLGALYDELEDESAADRRPQAGYLSDDDCGLCYAGTSNGIYGDGGIGKTLILSRLQVEAFQRGQTVVHWEFDNNSDRAIVRRLKNAGATRDQVAKQFRVLRSEEDIAALPSDFADAIGLVTLDAITPAITALGAEVNHPSGMDMALRAFLAPFTVRGATGLFIGHVGHENRDRQAGSVRMYQAVQGALYQAQVIKQPEIGSRGLVALTLRKDNQGWAGPVNQVAAYVSFDSTAGDGSLNVYFTRQRDAQGVEDDKREQFTARLDKARLTEREEIDILLKIVASDSTALNASALHIKTRDMGFSISERKIKERLRKMTEDSLIFVDANASKAAASTKGGRPSDHYRACAIPKNQAK
ncbi:bifunctional DNA primase/polymerase [Streptomyces sp. NBC_01451]|uniref:bifunctional DNA primase/polymerase n=1 Tax=Streptomyces sp. NBC_01451 TaxID=2903872 RepID=UPI002E353DF0|nr:bifunctional DNA primase/polymerase [Streptomyces sp. NBC_01451]